MIFLITSLFLVTASVFGMALSLPEGMSVRNKILMKALPFVASINLGMASIVSIFFSGSWSSDSINLIPNFIFLAGAFGLLAYGRYLQLYLKDIQSKFERQLSELFCVLCFAASCYMIFVALDHYSFFRDKSTTGIVSAQMFDKSDVQCSASIIIVREEGNDIRYRCPTTMMLGNPFGEPFIPWPHYDEKVSYTLSKVREDMIKNAIHIGPDSTEPQN